MSQALSALFLLAIGFVIYYLWVIYTSDAPFIPLKTKLVKEVIKIANVDKGDIFYDLGSGDGRLVVAASLEGAKAYGVEIDKLRVFYSRLWIKLLRLERKAKIIKKDIFETDLSKATVVCMYLLPITHQKLKRKLKKELEKGTRVVCVDFEINDWKPEKIKVIPDIAEKLFLYRV
jgi:16S rRNA A1518/A1519 N6-dimethyltransferase RsmA/KsgA/DIM1 with predicted DNA glycosylase/AP lyase activity